MSGFYRIGEPGEDTIAHINTGRRSSGAKCVMDRFPADNSQWGPACGRMSVALCDAPMCDKPICAKHRVKHSTKANTDFCTEHASLAQAPLDSGALQAKTGVALQNGKRNK